MVESIPDTYQRACERRNERLPGPSRMTLDAAYLAFEEDKKGSLAEGKLGDVVVLESDPHEVAPHEIRDIPVAMTIVGGRDAHSTF